MISAFLGTTIIDYVFPAVIVLITVAGLTSGVLRAISDFRKTQAQIQKSQDEIARAETQALAQPEKAKPAWDLARATLEAYFNRNLSQISWIFWLSVSVMMVGFFIIAFGIWQAVRSQGIVTPAAMATLAGIITEFIGATFLFVYRSTIQQAINYSRTLERINSVGMAMQILDTMPNKTRPEDLKSKTKASLVELLARQSYELPPPPFPEPGQTKKN